MTHLEQIEYLISYYSQNSLKSWKNSVYLKQLRSKQRRIILHQPGQGVPAQSQVCVQRQAVQRLQVALQSHHFHHDVSL